MANNQMELNLPKGGIFFVVIIVAVIILFSKSTITIGPGEGGVIFESLGSGINTERTYGEGFHIVAPWNRMIVRKVRQQSISDEMNVLSVNGLEVKVNGTIWYEPEFKNLGLLIKTKGEDYERELLDPAINAAARSVVGRYTPEQLYSSKRDVIEQEILDEIQIVLKNQYLLVTRVLVEDVKLPTTIRTAIETKLKQEQESLEYEFRIAKAEKEAKRQEIDAEGKAIANKILSASLTDKILQEKGIEATLELSKSPNSKVIIIGSGKSGMPIILGNQ
ncbi:Regulator of protease activity HflC, stomatin/prohibitin superfamily [Polaribacter sp. Hel1_33_78]|mgnify:FL=1|jgi:prohibitin 2|uniref:prohibitin family protein n=1 Tax=unclassified Polaribacter TaxID=196858 RepID=UPI00052C855F|nr:MULTISPECIES: prohibitin family protein [unclassified Polaribacter]KGL61034.1 SPFH domain protein / band 7 family protein [Polaribacter sp. Hel1_33_49]MBT3741089.1 prohibitin family protein [Polaribacter sp.]MBT4413245.1 prohibitin family protein [Polaribacter sp.]MBT7815867.1 prohibitin family protein [Polaribacter sp.]MDG1195235.1 prohibitin family protein [Polaribacter sp.]